MKNFIISVITACLVIGTANAVSKKLCVGVPYIKEIKLSGTQSVNLGSNQAWTVSVTSDYSNSNKAVDWSVSSGSGFASITSPTNTSATINGIKVNSDGTSSATIRAAAKDGSGLYDEKTINISCPTSGVSPANGTFSAVSPYTSNTNCRYTAPSKTISGCYSVSVNTVLYSGSSWPASTYKITANSGYYISGNDSASATCVACSSSACTGSQPCTRSCTIANGTCSYSGATQTRTSTACTNGTGNTYTSTQCSDSWNTCSGGTMTINSCNTGFTLENGACVEDASCPTYSRNTTLTVCSSFTTTSRFPYKGCGAPTTNGSNWEVAACTLSSGTSPIYGKSVCATNYDSGRESIYRPGQVFADICYRPVSSTPSGTNGSYCWCQLCTDANRTTCGYWVYESGWTTNSNCSSSCPDFCGRHASSNYGDAESTRIFNFAICSKP